MISASNYVGLVSSEVQLTITFSRGSALRKWTPASNCGAGAVPKRPPPNDTDTSGARA